MTKIKFIFVDEVLVLVSVDEKTLLVIRLLGWFRLEIQDRRQVNNSENTETKDTPRKRNNAKQNYPGLVAFYNTWPGNEMSLFYNAPEPTRGIPHRHFANICITTIKQTGSKLLKVIYRVFFIFDIWCTGAPEEYHSVFTERYQEPINKYIHGTRQNCSRGLKAFSERLGLVSVLASYVSFTTLVQGDTFSGIYSSMLSQKMGYKWACHLAYCWTVN